MLLSQEPIPIPLPGAQLILTDQVLKPFLLLITTTSFPLHQETEFWSQPEILAYQELLRLEPIPISLRGAPLILTEPILKPFLLLITTISPPLHQEAEL